ncbi:MAG: Hsp20/alpha crystallin family protein [Bacilli bacterium]|nr:Hsp20/alpha crystallin family protein [Bacilli bacterium]
MNYLQRSFFNDIDFLDSNIKTDIIDNENEYILISDLPNIKKEDIKVNYDNGYLTIAAIRESLENNYIQKERFYGEYKRNYYIGQIDESKIEAKYENGTLTIKVPKQALENRERNIEIK